MISLFAVGTYLAIGAFVAMFAWSKRDQDAWLANDPRINGLTLLYVMVFWPRVFVVFVRVLRKRLAVRRANGRKIVVHSGGKTFHIVPAQKATTHDRTER